MSETVPPRVGSLLLGPVLIALAVIGLHNVLTDPYLGMDMGADPGPDLFPIMLLGALGLGGLIQTAVCGLRAWRAGGIAPDPELAPRVLLAPALLVVSLILYNLAVFRLGYLAATFILAVVWLPVVEWLTGGRIALPRLALFVVEAVLIAGFLYIVFRHGIRVPLP
jgi:hypothetical protein